MKKLYTVALAIAFAITGLNAKTLDQARIYINPGHGNYGPNDRPNATIPYPNLPETGRPDTLGFYESNTNLWKALKMAPLLKKLGAKEENLIYSRVRTGVDENGNSYDRRLSEICEEVEANNMDYFISIHSNAATEGSTVNYPLILYRGKDGRGNEYAPGSYEMAEGLWPILFDNALGQIDPKSYYSMTKSNLRGDVSFYGSESSRTDPTSGKTYSGYLGVLKHGAPGYLSEGYFHTYQPARHRALNKDYCGQEGIRYARAIAKYFGAEGEKTGYIMGTVKDLHERMHHQLFNYAPGTNDEWVPLNGATVDLYKDGQKIKTYTVDNNYNGIFVFENLEPGDYTIDCTLEGYKALEEKYKEAITVKANETAYTMVYLESESYIPPTITYVNYPDPDQPEYLKVPAEFNFAKEYEETYAGIEGKVLRTITRGDSTIVLTDNAGVPALYLVNNITKTVEKQISTTGLAQKDAENDNGFFCPLSDISMSADGKLIGCNEVRTFDASATVDDGFKRGTLTIYKWDSLDADPTAWITTSSAANWFKARMGHTLAISGSTDEAKILVSGTNNYYMDRPTKTQGRWLVIHVNGGVATSESYTEATIGDEFTDTPNQFIVNVMGEDFKVTVSPRADDQFIVDGCKITPFEFKLPASSGADCTPVGRMDAAQIDVKANGASYFKYAKHALMVAPTTDAEGLSTGVKLFDITEGVDKATEIKTNNTTWNPATVTFASAAATVEGEDINIFVAQDNKITKLTTKTAEQPKVAAIFATNLNVVDNTDSYKFTFDANDNAVDANLVFTNGEGAEAAVINVPNVVKGANEVTVQKSELPNTEMTWAVKLTGKAISNISVINDRPAFGASTAGRGVAVDNSPESEFFGNYYANERLGSLKCGIHMYKQDGTHVGKYAETEGGLGALGNTVRLAIDDRGTVYAADWKDASSGVWMFDPANPTNKMKNLFRNCTRQGDGTLVTADGTAVSSSTVGIAITGEGENTVLYVTCEDIGPNEVLMYNLGTQNVWNAAPTKTFNVHDYLINGNCNIVPDKGGIWVSQIRTAGNNAGGVPSLIYVNADGEITFNSGKVLSGDLNGSENAGFQISPDGKTLVINECKGILKFFDITWEGTTPTATYKYSYSSGDSSYQMAWDYAGNLYTVGKYLTVYSLPTDVNECTTPAKKAMTVKGTGSSSIEENTIEEVSVNIYPNPVTDVMNIESNQEIENVKVFSTSGAMMINTNESSIDVSGLASGVYLVKVNDTEVVRVIKK